VTPVTPSEIALWVGVPVLGPIALAAITVAITYYGPDAAREVAEWWRRRRRPTPVAAAGHPTYHDHTTWASTLPMRQLRRQARALDRRHRRGRLRGDDIVRMRALRTELTRRLDASQRPNRAAMDYLAPKDREFIRRLLNRRRPVTAAASPATPCRSRPVIARTSTKETNQ